MRFEYQTDNLGELEIYSLFDTYVDFGFSPVLYHYTLTSNEAHIFANDYIDLRLTRADSFSDVLEGKHIANLFKTVCNEALTQGTIDAQYAEMMRAAIEEYQPVCEKTRRNYVFCFSKEPENEYLTNNYAKRGNSHGLVFGLQTIQLEELTLDRATAKDGEFNAVHLCDVVYDFQKMKKSIHELIERAYALRLQDDRQYTITRRLFVNQMAMYSLVYKLDSFAEEKESRLVVDVSRTIIDKPPFRMDEDERYLHLLLPKSSLYRKRIL